MKIDSKIKALVAEGPEMIDDKNLRPIAQSNYDEKLSNLRQDMNKPKSLKRSYLS